MQPYLDLMRHVLDNGNDKSDRTGTGTRSVFGWQMRFDLARGFPVMTTKKLHLKSIIHELLWFIQGDTNIKYLQENGVSIWDEWADENGDLGPVYGKQWRRWETPDGRVIDQITQLVHSLKNNPDSRRHIVSAWNPGDVDNMALPPCHCAVPVLRCQRQAQLPALPALGRHLPRRALQHRLLCAAHDDAGAGVRLPAGRVRAHLRRCTPRTRTISSRPSLQLTREPRALPTMWINPEVKDIFAFTFEDFRLDGYDPHPHIAAPVAV